MYDNYMWNGNDDDAMMVGVQGICGERYGKLQNRCQL